MRSWKRFLLDLLYPNRCGCCQALLAWDAEMCEACKAQLPPPQQKDRRVAEVERVFAAFSYEGVAKAGVLSLKNSENLNFAHYAGAALARMLDGEMLDLIVPVPMNEKKQRARGYNQAEVIAREIAERLHLTVRTDCLTHAQTQTEQHALHAAERAEHALCIQVAAQDLSGKRILLCDDVLTTGSTLTRCAMLLKEQGAASVLAAVATLTPRKQNLEETHGYRD